MSRMDVPLPQLRGLAETQRRDAWWVAPLLTFLGFSAFIVYSTWAAFQGKDFYYGGLGSNGADYLSPFYSPLLFEVPGQGGAHHAWFGAAPEWLMKIWPAFVPFSPALLILWAPGGFRFTCYYYRGAYYKAFWADPPSCAVGEPAFRRKRFRGENSFPLIIQNVHRYFLYLALVFIVVLFWDAWKGFWFVDPSRPDLSPGHPARTFGVAVGSLVMLINPILISSYTLGCHSLRHIIGGRKDCISECSAARRSAYDGVSCLNRRHMMWAWLSLFWVGFTDVYVRLCAKGIITDFRLF